MRFWSRRESPAAPGTQAPRDGGTSADAAPAAAAAAAADTATATGSCNDSSEPAVLTSADIRRQLARLMEDAAGWMEANRLAVRWAALAAAAGGLAFLLHGGHVSGWRQYTSLTDVLPQLLAGEARRLPVVVHSVEQRDAVVALRVAHYPLLRRLAAQYRGHPPSLTAQHAEQRGHLLTAYLAGLARPTPAGMQYLGQLDREAVHYLRPLSVVLAEDSPRALDAASSTALSGAAAVARPAGLDRAAVQPAVLPSAAAAVQPTGLSGAGEAEGARRPAGWAGGNSDASSSGGGGGGSGSNDSHGADSTADGALLLSSALPPDGQLASAVVCLPPAPQPDKRQLAAATPWGGTQHHQGSEAGNPPLQLWGELYARRPRRRRLGALLPRWRRDVAEVLIRRGEAATMDPETLEWLGVSSHRASRLSAAERSAVNKGRGMWAMQRLSLAAWCRGLARRALQRWRSAARPS